MGVHSRVTAEVAINNFFFSASSGLLSRSDGHLKSRTRLGRTIRMLLEVRQETKVHFLVGTVRLGFLSFLKKCQA